MISETSTVAAKKIWLGAVFIHVATDYMNILYVNFCRFFNKDLGFSEDILGNYMKNIVVSGFEENWLNDEEATPIAELETEIDYRVFQNYFP